MERAVACEHLTCVDTVMLRAISSEWNTYLAVTDTR